MLKNKTSSLTVPNQGSEEKCGGGKRWSGREDRTGGLRPGSEEILCTHLKVG